MIGNCIGQNIFISLFRKQPKHFQNKLEDNNVVQDAHVKTKNVVQEAYGKTKKRFVFLFYFNQI